MQPRFEQRTSKAAMRMVEQARFRAAYDFLLLRAAAGEIEPELAEWWTNFIESDPEIRQELINQRQRASARHGGAGATEPGGRRRRSRGGRGRTQGGGESVASDAPDAG
jgi:poly(A) polymerase